MPPRAIKTLACEVAFVQSELEISLHFLQFRVNRADTNNKTQFPPSLASHFGCEFLLQIYEAGWKQVVTTQKCDMPLRANDEYRTRSCTLRLVHTMLAEFENGTKFLRLGITFTRYRYEKMRNGNANRKSLFKRSQHRVTLLGQQCCTMLAKILSKFKLKPTSSNII